MHEMEVPLILTNGHPKLVLLYDANLVISSGPSASSFSSVVVAAENVPATLCAGGIPRGVAGQLLNEASLQ